MSINPPSNSNHSQVPNLQKQEDNRPQVPNLQKQEDNRPQIPPFGFDQPNGHADLSTKMGSGMNALTIEGLNEFITGLDPVKEAINEANKIFEIKAQISPNMGLTDLTSTFMKISELRASLTEKIVAISNQPAQLLELASKLGDQMAKTDGADMFFNNLQQEIFEILKHTQKPEPHFEPIKPIHFRPDFKVD